MPASDAAVALYHQRLALYRERTSAGLVAAWDGLNAYRDEDMAVFVGRTAPLLSGAKTVTVATSAAFFALMMETRPVAVRSDEVMVEPRISHPFLAMRHALAKGRSIEEAVAAGRSQAEAVGFDFIQSVSRQTGDFVAERSFRST